MTAKPLRLIVCGAAGRMGSRVAALAAADPRFSLAACVFHREGGDSRGARAIRPEELPEHLARADALIDFTAPEASVRMAAAAAAARKAAVIGTTGFSAVQLAQLKSLSSRIPVFLSPNFSPAVNLMFRLCAEAARALGDYDASISEIHHSRKRDAPSGTALRLSQAVMEGRSSREPVATVSQRLGDVVGEHTLTLAGPFERLEITHRAHSRSLFARGALEAALWVARKKPGLYDMLALMELK